MLSDYWGDDAWDKDRLNIRTADRDSYNCGGYALGLDGWYCPWEDYDQRADVYDLLEDENYSEAEAIMVNTIMKENHLTELAPYAIREKTVDYKKYEVIAFRIDTNLNDFDFHFAKLGRNGNWYEKRGAQPRLYRHEYNWVFGIWADRYDGEIYYFIRERG